MAVSVAACFASAPAWALPTGAQVAAGSASFSQVGNSLTIANTPGAIINWNAFSIGALEAVRFDQQNSLSSVLNRVTGGSASAIHGALSSNGRVFLINPNGILFGAGSRIDVNGLIASTLNISDQDFLAGKLNFQAGDTVGGIRNAGTLQASPGGNIYLIAPDIENSGIVRAPNGEVVLAAGRQVSLVDGAHPDIQVVVSAPADRAVNLGAIASGKVSVFGALLSQRGTVSADTVETDAAGRIVFRATKQLDVEAGSRTTANGGTGGTVVLQSAGDTYVRGAVEATGGQGQGGTIAALGERVAVMDQAVLDASGAAGGGRIMVGGDYQGRNPAVHNAQVTYFGPDATLKADAGNLGAGGTVIVWADDTTRAFGSISARGGGEGGDGGFVETSGKRTLDLAGIRVNAGTARGHAGKWLLDPDDYVIDGDQAGAISGALENSDVSIVTSATTASCTNLPCDGAQSGNGDILVNSDIIWTAASTPTTLTLNAYRDITFKTGSDTALTGNGGSVVLNAGGAINGYDLAGGTGANLRTTLGGTLTASAAGGNVFLKSLQTGGSIPTDFGGDESLTSGSITVSAPAGAVSIADGATTALVHAEGSSSTTTTGAIAISARDDISVGGAIDTSHMLGGWSSYKEVGSAGNIDVHSAFGALDLHDIKSGVYTFQTGTVSGNGGDINLSSGTAILVDGVISSAAFNNDDNTSIGKGGNITIDAGSGIDVTGYIDASSRTAVWIYYSGPNSTAGGGNVNLIARNGSLSVGGNIDTSSGIIDDWGTSSYDAASVGSAGSVSLTSIGHSISLGGSIYANVRNADAATTSGGNGGTITIHSGSDGGNYQDFLFSGTMDSRGSGPAGETGGNIAITSARDIWLQPGSVLINNRGAGVTLTAGRDIKLTSDYVESQTDISSSTNGVVMAAGRDVVLDASGEASDGGVAEIHATGNVGVTAGGAVTLTANGGDTSASIYSTGGNVVIAAVGDVGLTASGGSNAYAGIYAEGGDVSVQGRSVSLTANADNGAYARAEIYALNNATVLASGGVGDGGVRLAATGDGNEALIWVDGGSGTVDVRSYGGVALSSSEGGYASISAQGGASENVAVVAYGGDITLAATCTSACGGGAEIYGYDGDSAGGAVYVEAKAGNIALTNASDGWVGIDGGSGTTVRASGAISATGDPGAKAPYIGWLGGVTLVGASLSLDNAEILDETDAIHIEVDGNISLTNASHIGTTDDVYLTLKGSGSILSLDASSQIISVLGSQGGGGRRLRPGGLHDLYRLPEPQRHHQCHHHRQHALRPGRLCRVRGQRNLVWHTTAAGTVYVAEQL